MKSAYVILVINGRKKIKSIPPADIVDVAAAVIIKGAEKGEVYITIDDVPEKYREDVIAALEAEGYDSDGNYLE